MLRDRPGTSTLYPQQPKPSAPPLEQLRGSLNLEDIVTQSTLFNSDSQILAKNILDEFNRHVDKTASCFTTSLVRGKWLNRDEFLLGHRNKRAELAGFNEFKNIATVINPDPRVVTETLMVVKQNAPFYGAHGTFVLNVPVGKYARAVRGNMPVLFDSGPHVIHDPTFKFDQETGFINKFQYHIQHYTLQILRVPMGKIAKIWDGNEPRFLEGPALYVTNNPFFNFTKKDENTYFHDATEKLIIHGSLKRVMPSTGEVAVSYNNGALEVIEPRVDNTPTLIREPSHFVSREFLSVGIQNLEFPSDATKAKRLSDNKDATPDDLSYHLFTTRDSLKVGVKLFVAYRITKPQLALESLLSHQGILTHIEDCAAVDMGMAIQQCTSQEFLNSNVNKPKMESQFLKDLQSLPPGTVEASQKKHNIQDEVKKKLREDLDAYGIELVRLNFETPKMMDVEIAKKMSEQSLLTAEASSKVACLEQNYQIAQRHAEQEAKTLEIAQKQKNDATISKAEAEKAAAQLSADAITIKAEAERRAAELRGQVYVTNPKLFELEIMRMQMEALAKATLVPPQLNPMLTSGLLNSPFAFFNAQTQAQTPRPPQLEVVKQPDVAPTPPVAKMG